MRSEHPSLGNEVRVRFGLEVEDGFPPISVELLIGVMESENIVRIDNTPFFVEGIALNDVVKCTGLGSEVEFDYLIKESGHKALSVIFIDNECKENLCKNLALEKCYVEFGKFPEYDMLAIAIPPDVDYTNIKNILEPLEIDSRISVAELCVV